MATRFGKAPRDELDQAVTSGYSKVSTMQNEPKFSEDPSLMRRVSRSLPSLLLVLVFAYPLWGQGGSSQAAGGLSSFENPKFTRQTVTIDVGVRDARGLPLDDKATVRISSVIRSVNKTAMTEANSTASFPNLLEGPYELEILCPGYRSVVQHLDVNGGLAFFSTYVYLHSENEVTPTGGPAKGLVLTPKLAAEIDKGLASMHKHQYEAAKQHFGKAEKLVPESSDVAYLMGTANLGMGQTDIARQDFQRSITLDRIQ